MDKKVLDKVRKSINEEIQRDIQMLNEYETVIRNLRTQIVKKQGQLELIDKLLKNEKSNKR